MSSPSSGRRTLERHQLSILDPLPSRLVAFSQVVLVEYVGRGSDGGRGVQRVSFESGTTHALLQDLETLGWPVDPLISPSKAQTRLLALAFYGLWVTGWAVGIGLLVARSR